MGKASRKKKERAKARRGSCPTDQRNNGCHLRLAPTCYAFFPIGLPSLATFGSREVTQTAGLRIVVGETEEELG